MWIISKKRENLPLKKGRLWNCFLIVQKNFRSILPVLWIALSAIDGASFFRFKGNFTFFSAISADCFVHCSWAKTTTSITHLFFTSTFETIQNRLFFKTVNLELESFCMLGYSNIISVFKVTEVYSFWSNVKPSFPELRYAVVKSTFLII